MLLLERHVKEYIVFPEIRSFLRIDDISPDAVDVYAKSPSYEGHRQMSYDTTYTLNELWDRLAVNILRDSSTRVKVGVDAPRSLNIVRGELISPEFDDSARFEPDGTLVMRGDRYSMERLGNTYSAKRL